MTKTKTGCYRAFCAEHKHLGKTKKTRKRMKLPAKPKVIAVGANKQYQLGQVTFTNARLDTFRTYKCIDDMRTNNATGYRYIMWDNRPIYAHAAYSYCIPTASTCVRSKGYATAKLAAEAALQQIQSWLDQLADDTQPNDMSDDDNSAIATFPIKSPPDDWNIQGKVMVDVEGHGWIGADVINVFDDGWFHVRLFTVEDGEWFDYLNWMEEGTDWKRPDDPVQCIEKKRCATCKMSIGKCRKPGNKGHLAIVTTVTTVKAAEKAEVVEAAEHVVEAEAEVLETVTDAEVLDAEVVFVEAVALTTPVTETMAPIAAAPVAAAVAVPNNTPMQVETADTYDDDDAMQALARIREVCKNITGVSA